MLIAAGRVGLLSLILVTGSAAALVLSSSSMQEEATPPAGAPRAEAAFFLRPGVTYEPGFEVAIHAIDTAWKAQPGATHWSRYVYSAAFSADAIFSLACSTLASCC